MTETANEALIRNAYAAFALGEIDKLLDLVDPNLEWTYLDPGLPDPAPQTCHGRGELAAALSRQAESGLSSRLEEVRRAATRSWSCLTPLESTPTESHPPTTATTTSSACGRAASWPSRPIGTS